MGIEVQSPVDDELHLLTEWGAPDDRRRIERAGALSMLVHAAAITGLLLMPTGVIPVRRELAPQVTPLVEPLTELTQRAPNKGRIQKQFNELAMQERARLHIPPAAPSTTRPAAPRPVPLPPVQARALPAPALPEPPKADAGGRVPPAPPPVVAPQLAQIQPPQIQAQETRPKSPFETPSAPGSIKGAVRISPPGSSVAEAMRGPVRGGGSGGIAAGDRGSGIGGIGEGVSLPPSPGGRGSSLELLSDPLGVDFKPYLVKVLAAVRRNWWAVMPEAARYGRRGKVEIQFSVARNGSVPKLVIAAGSGTDALDRAAVAGISASNPFPPLPSEYKGEQIRLRFNFAYNMPSQ